MSPPNKAAKSKLRTMILPFCLGTLLTPFFVAGLFLISSIPSCIESRTDARGRRLFEDVLDSLSAMDFDTAKAKTERIDIPRWKAKSQQRIAEELASNGFFDEAIRMAETIGEELPEFPFLNRDCAYRFIVSALASDERFDKIDELVKRISRQDMRDISYGSIVKAQIEAGLFDNARQSIKNVGDHPHVLATHARLLLEKGHFTDALESVRRIPIAWYGFKKVPMYCELATHCIQAGDLDEAARILNEAIEGRPSFEEEPRQADVLFNILQTFRKAGNADAGRRFVRDVTKKFPPEKIDPQEHWEILAETAILHAEQGDFDEAWRIAESISAPLATKTVKNTAYEEILRYRLEQDFVAAFHDTERIDDVSVFLDTISPLIANLAPGSSRFLWMAAFEWAIGSEPNLYRQSERLQLLLHWQLQDFRFDAAQETIRRRTELKVSRWDNSLMIQSMFFSLGVAQVREGKIGDALQSARKLGKRDRYPLLKQIAVAEAKAGRFDEAMKYLKQIKSEQSLHDSALYEIAVFQINQGRLDEAEKTIALIGKPGRQLDAVLPLAEALIDADRREDAIRWTSQLIPMMNESGGYLCSWQEPRTVQFSTIAQLESRLGRFPEALAAARRISICAVPIRASALAFIAEAQAAAHQFAAAEKTLEEIRWRSAEKIKAEASANIDTQR